jgi:phenylacetate-coenzyme A ligase PaaK-like adenylate-forming protein
MNSMVMLEMQEKWKQFTPQDAKTQETKLKETLKRAAVSPLYKKLWKTSGFNVEAFESLNDLNQIPLLSRKQLYETTQTQKNKVCLSPVSHWFLSSEPSEPHEWFPLSGEDFLAISPMLTRLSQTAGLRKGDVVLAVVDTPPRISSFIPYLWSNAADCGLEFIIGGMDWYDKLGMSWINFIQKRRPTAIFTSTTNAKALAQKIADMNPSVKNALSELRVGVFFGNQMETDMVKGLEPYSNLEPFEVYSPTEHITFCMECRSHSGIHIWLDTCIPEVLSVGQKETQLLSKTQPDVEGELVLTNFSLALPLVRYKTGKFVRVEGVGECSCGCNHPKVKFLKK